MTVKKEIYRRSIDAGLAVISIKKNSCAIIEPFPPQCQVANSPSDLYLVQEARLHVMTSSSLSHTNSKWQMQRPVRLTRNFKSINGTVMMILQPTSGQHTSQSRRNMTKQ